MEFRIRFGLLLGVAMALAGFACLAWAVIEGHSSAWSAAAMCFCAAGVCLLQRRKPPEEA